VGRSVRCRRLDGSPEYRCSVDSTRRTDINDNVDHDHDDCTYDDCTDDDRTDDDRTDDDRTDDDRTDDERTNDERTNDERTNDERGDHDHFNDPAADGYDGITTDNGRRSVGLSEHHDDVDSPGEYDDNNREQHDHSSTGRRR
jgi:hypothetical protein